MIAAELITAFLFLSTAPEVNVEPESQAMGLVRDSAVQFVAPLPLDHFSITRRHANHRALDMRAPRGTEIVAAAAGEVIHAGRLGAYGILVAIGHPGGHQTRYAHLDRLDVAEGDLVRKGQVLGTVGMTGRTTGPHLHFELMTGGNLLSQSLPATDYVRLSATEIIEALNLQSWSWSP